MSDSLNTKLSYKKEHAKAGRVYRHYKNGRSYKVIGVALQTETNEKLVIYQPMYESEQAYFARPYEMFVGDVQYEGKLVKRFQEVLE